MKFELNLNKEKMQVIGEKGLRIGKTIVFEGVKAIVLKTAATTVNTAFAKGATTQDIKNVFKFDEVFGEKDNKPKKKWFAKKEDVVADLIDDIIENPETAKDVVQVKKVK